MLRSVAKMMRYQFLHELNFGWSFFYNAVRPMQWTSHMSHCIWAYSSSAAVHYMQTMKHEPACCRTDPICNMFSKFRPKNRYSWHRIIWWSIFQPLQLLWLALYCNNNSSSLALFYPELQSHVIWSRRVIGAKRRCTLLKNWIVCDV